MTLKSNKAALGAGAAAIAAAAGLYALLGDAGALTGADPGDRELVALGEGVYRDNCAACHGADLEGEPGWRTRNADGTLKAPPHDETGHTWHHPDQMLFDYTKLGGQAVVGPDFKSAMPGFQGTLDDREVWAVLAFIKSRWPPPARERQRLIDERSR